MKRAWTNITIALSALAFSQSVSAQMEQPPGALCGVRSPSAVVEAVDQPGGIYLPARGILRVLVIFASFPDDETPQPYWPPHAPPSFMADFIDPDTSTHSSGPFNLTDYFRRMSLGSFLLVGDAVWIETSHSQEEYRANGSFGGANHDLFIGRGDSAIDFSRFDGWTMSMDHMQSPQPDGQVDMIVMVWRTTIFGYLGQALLGPGRPPDTLDNVRIAMGYPGYSTYDSVYHYQAGSGVTCECLPGDTPQKVMRTAVHEISHWLLGREHPYNVQTSTGKHEYWGMLCTSHRLSSCANAYDRERLGWIAVPELPLDSLVSLPDYLPTGAAFKFHPPLGDPYEYFYFENHQLSSPFDDVTLNPQDRGLWVLHQDAPYNDFSDFLRIAPSDGYWDWNVPQTTSSCFGQTLPVFERSAPRVFGGLSHRDELTTPASAVEWMYVRADSLGAPECGSFLGGAGFSGAFSLATEKVFSPTSNPSNGSWGGNAAGWALEIVNDSADTMQIQTYSRAVDASPARRYLGDDPTVDQSKSVGVTLGWGDQWSAGQPLESDFQSSELQRRAGGETVWTGVYSGPAIRWRDTTYAFLRGGVLSVHYRVRVHDTQGKVSNWSPEFSILSGGPDDVVSGDATLAGVVSLGPNFPNPFNPSTTIRFSLGGRGMATILIVDLLGREVRQFVREAREAGEYSVTWDGTDGVGRHVSSGVYIAQLIAGGEVRRWPMLLVR